MNRNDFGKTIYAAGLAALLAITTCGCSQDNMETGDYAGTLTVRVSDGGYSSADGTRAEESGYNTAFTSGDKIGLFAVTGGKTCSLVDNVCLTLNDDGEWKTIAGTDPIYIPGATYYAYYPYTDKTTVEPTATTVDGFFYTLISEWTPKEVQSTYADYTASDLMVATATASNSSLSLSMEHKMGLVVIDLPKTKYVFTDTSLPTSIVPTEATFSGATPWYSTSEKSYRYIVNPSSPATISGSYADDTRDFYFSATSEAGKYYKYNIDGGQSATVEASATLSVGDYFCVDDDNNYFIIPNTVSSDIAKGENVIGLVFYVGQLSDDTTDYTSSIGQAKCHGYVVALTDAASEVSWSNAKSKASAYTVNGKTAPTSTSGWQLPTIDLLQVVWNISDSQFTAVGGDAPTSTYWSSTSTQQSSSSSDSETTNDGGSITIGGGSITTGGSLSIVNYGIYVSRRSKPYSTVSGSKADFYIYNARSILAF